MKTIIIDNNDANQRLDKFLTKSLKELPIALMYKYIRKKRIKINSKKCTPATRLLRGDVLTFYINDEFFINDKEPTIYDFLKAPNKVNIVYEDNNIILLDKKPGLIVHPDKDYHFDSLINRVKHYLYDKGDYDPKKENSFVPSLANRIDRNTGGIVIVAKNAEALRILNEKIKNREIKKTYICIACGIFNEKSDILTAFLKKDENKNRVYLFKKPAQNLKTIKTKYKVIAEKSNFSLLEVELITGRTHQIRAQMAYIEHPLLGDGKYGLNNINRKKGYKYQALYSYKISFDFISDSSILNYLNKKEFSVNDIWFLEDFYKFK